MMRTRKGMNIKFLILTVALIIAVLVITWMMLSIITKGSVKEEGSTNTECEKQESEDDCTSLTTDNWVGEKKNKCFWDDQEGTCGTMVR